MQIKCLFRRGNKEFCLTSWSEKVLKQKVDEFTNLSYTQDLLIESRQPKKACDGQCMFLQVDKNGILRERRSNE